MATGIARFVSKVPQVEFMLFSPEMAEEALASSAGSRPLTWSSVDQLASDLVPNQPPHPDTIVFNRKGQLTNGHHRLTAQTVRGISVNWTVFWGNSPMMEPKQDTTRPRKLWEHLLSYETDQFVGELVQGSVHRAQLLAALTGSIYSVLVGLKNPSIPNALRIIRFFQPSYEFAFRTCARDNLTKRAAIMTAVVFAHHQGLGADGSPDTLRGFIDATRTGENICSGEPAFTLRTYLLGITKRTRGKANITRGATDSQWVIQIKVLRAFQAEILGESLRALQLPKRSRAMIEWFIGPTQEAVTSIGIELFSVDREQKKLVPLTEAAKKSTIYRKSLGRNADSKQEASQPQC